MKKRRSGVLLMRAPTLRVTTTTTTTTVRHLPRRRREGRCRVRPSVEALPRKSFPVRPPSSRKFPSRRGLGNRSVAAAPALEPADNCVTTSIGTLLLLLHPPLLIAAPIVVPLRRKTLSPPAPISRAWQALGGMLRRRVVLRSSPSFPPHRILIGRERSSSLPHWNK